MLHAELEDHGVSLLDVGRALRQLNDKVQFIVIMNPRSWLTEEINELAPRGFISKPFDAVELAKMMNNGNPTAPKPESATSRPVPVDVPADLPWLQDINRAAQHLTRLTFESGMTTGLLCEDPFSPALFTNILRTTALQIDFAAHVLNWLRAL